MPIDPSIPLQVKNIQLESPVNRLAMMGEAVKLGEMQRSIDTQNKLRELYSQGIDVGTPEGFKQFASVDPDRAIKLKNDALKTQELQGNIKKTNLEVDAAQRIGAVQRIVGAPDAATAANIIKTGMQDGSIPVEQGNSMLSQLNTSKYPDWQMNMIRSVVKPSDIYKESYTPAIKEYKFGKTDPGFTNYQMNKAAASAARSTVILPPQEKAEQTERGKFLVEDYKTVTNAARVAARTLPAIEVNLDLIDQGFKTGFGTEVQKGAANILGALGVKNANEFATNAQVFQAKANEAVLQRQLEQKGPQTESDAQRITQTGAQLTNTADANKFILDVAKAQLKRDIEQRNFYDSWYTKNKTYDGAEDAWYTGNGGKSLFERPELKKYNIQASSNPQRSGSQQNTGGLTPAEQAELESLRKQLNPAKK